MYTSGEQLSVLQSTLKAAESRRAELERLVQSCYEDRVQGRIPVDVCSRLISQYEAERREKYELTRSLTEQIENFKTEQVNMREWSAAIREFADIQAIDRDIALKLIEKIEIGEREIIGNQKQREVRIHYKFVGFIG
jgi:hypothetical protein